MTKAEQWVIKCLTQATELKLTNKEKIEGTKCMFANAVSSAFIDFAENTIGETSFQNILQHESKSLIELCFEIYEMHKNLRASENVTSIFQRPKQ